MTHLLVLALATLAQPAFAQTSPKPVSILEQSGSAPSPQQPGTTAPPIQSPAGETVLPQFAPEPTDPRPETEIQTGELERSTAPVPDVAQDSRRQNNPDQIDINRFLTQLVLDSIPHTYEEDKDWGGQEERFDGLEIERDGLRIETRRKKKMVNHGTWKKYSAQLLNPQQEFAVAVDNLHQTAAGETGFSVHFSAHVALQARQSKWVKGVQLYSISAEGHAVVRLTIECETGVSMDFGGFPPDLIFSPHVSAAQIHVDDLRIDRVSKLGGEFAQQVTRHVREILDEKISRREQRLVEKINKELDDNADKLRLSLAEAVDSKWSGAAKAFLPAPVQNALEAADHLSPSPKTPENSRIAPQSSGEPGQER